MKNPKTPPFAGANALAVPAARPPLPAVRGIAGHSTAVWQVRGCAALCAFGVVVGWIGLARELEYHAQPPERAGNLAAAALCLGVLLGFQFPKRLARRWRAASAEPSSNARPMPPATAAAAPTQTDDDPRWIASLAGALLLSLALLGLLLFGGGTLLETYRRFLTRNFVLPPQLLLTALWLPALGGLVLLGTLCAIALPALQGWHRRLLTPRPHLISFWLTVAAAGALAGLPALGGLRAERLFLPATLALFAAAGVAVFRKQTAPPFPAATAPALPQPLAARDFLVLFATGLLAALTGLAFRRAFGAEENSAAVVGGGVLSLAGACAAGLGAARRRPRLDSSAGPLIFAALACASAWLLPARLPALPGAAVLWLKIALAGGGLALWLAPAARRVARTTRNAPFAVYHAGTAVALGFGLAFAAGALRPNSPSAPSDAASSPGNAERNEKTVLQSEPRPSGSGPKRNADVFSSGPLPDGRGSDVSNTPSGAAFSAPSLGRILFATERLRIAQVFAASKNLDESWNIDLAGPRLDALFIERPPPGAATRQWEPADTRRFLRRCEAALRGGGRLIVETSTEPFDQVAREILRRAATKRGGAAYRIRCRGAHGVYEVLAYGPDLPEWLARAPRPAEWEITLEPL